MKKLSFLSVTLLAVLLGLSACGNKGGVHLLEGRIVGLDSVPEDVALGYCPDGNIYDTRMTDLQISPDGTFFCDPELVGDEADVTIEISGGGYFGVHLVKGKTVEMTIEKDADGKWVATFDGVAQDVNQFVNAYTQGFDQMRYWSPDPSEAKTNQEYRQLLDTEYQKLTSMLPTIGDQEQRDYYTHLTESEYKWLKIRLIMDRCEETGSDYREEAEYQELVKGIDVNNPVEVRTNMAFTSLSSIVKAKQTGDNGAYCEELMQLADSLVTNETLRTFLVQMIGQMYYAYGDGTGDYKAFGEKYIKWAGKDAQIAKAQAEQFENKVKATENTKAGAKAPDVELTTPEGKKVLLSSLVGNGKFTYIDVWATWCGPCCKEIPHLETLVEKYKGNDKVQFISISIDQDTKAWKKKLDNDKPQWAQFLIQGEVEQQFSKDWGISGIPRFIMIDKDGNIFNGDAPRPSNEETVRIIEEQLAL